MPSTLDPPDLLRLGDGWIPSLVELQESSGPVSPVYQFHTLIRVEATGAELREKIEDLRGWEDGDFRQIIRREGPLSAALYEALWADLLAMGALDLGGDLRGAAGPRIGASSNRLLLRLATREAEICYGSKDLSRSRNEAQARVVERVRRLLSPG